MLYFNNVTIFLYNKVYNKVSVPKEMFAVMQSLKYYLQSLCQ